MHEPKTCQECGISFSPPYRVTAKYWARRKFCSPECYVASNTGTARPHTRGPKGPVEDRFWPKVYKGAPDECWLWIGSTDAFGYGVLARSDGKQRLYRAHRVSYEIANGPIPAGLHVLHRCDTPPCVNPAHLFLGTQADNNRDRDTKGRSGQEKRRGERNGRAKLTMNQVREIRRRYEQGETQIALAREFGVVQPQVSRLVRRVQFEE